MARLPSKSIISSAASACILFEGLKKRFDYVIFDCEFDLKYLHQLVDIPIDVTLVVARPNEASIHLAKRIEEYSAKYAAGEQLGVILNKVNKQEMEPLLELLNKYDLTTLGTIPKDESLKKNRISKESEIVQKALEKLYYRLNIPQNEEM